MPLKVCLIVPGFSASEQDWCIPALLDFVRSMSARVDLHVFTLRWPERPDRYRIYGARVSAFGGRRHLGLRVGRLWADVVRTIYAEHQLKPFDVFHAFWADEPGWLAVFIAKILRRPAIVSLAGGELSGLKDINYGLRLLPGRRHLIEVCLTSAHRVTAGSRYMLKLAAATHGGSLATKLVWAPLGVDVDLFGRPQVSDERRKEGRLLNVGSLTPVKNHLLLMDVFKRLDSGSLFVAGSGPLQASLQNEVHRLNLASNVRFLGEVNHGRMPAVYGNSSLLVQSSRHEAQGMAVLEAAAKGLPLVGTSVGVLPEVGLAATSSADIADLARSIVDSPQRARELGESAQQRAAEQYSLTIATKRFYQLYEDVEGWH